MYYYYVLLLLSLLLLFWYVVLVTPLRDKKTCCHMLSTEAFYDSRTTYQPYSFLNGTQVGPSNTAEPAGSQICRSSVLNIGKKQACICTTVTRVQWIVAAGWSGHTTYIPFCLPQPSCNGFVHLKISELCMKGIASISSMKMLRRFCGSGVVQLWRIEVWGPGIMTWTFEHE